MQVTPFLSYWRIPILWRLEQVGSSSGGEVGPMSATPLLVPTETTTPVVED